MDDNLPRGAGDPDFYGYPHEHETTCSINVSGGSGENCNCKFNREKTIPIIFDHDHTQLPAGYLDADGKIKLRKECGITVERLANVGIGYIPKKVVDGVVVEAELIHISLIIKDGHENISN